MHPTRLISHGLARALRVCWLFLVSIVALSSLCTTAHAVPSFARQTGQDCGACHIGAYGPQLTPYGIKFKLNGYTETDGKGMKIPLSAMAVFGYTHTDKAQAAPPADRTKTNNNRTLDEASVFLAGRINDYLGTFVQVTYDGVGRQTSIDQADIRGVYTANIAGKDTVFGISLNNNPGVQDPFNTMPVWSFPYTASAVGFGTGDAATLINGGLEQRVGGLSAYAFWDDMLYAELGTYRTLSTWTQRKLSLDVADDPGRLGGNTLYWRLALFRDLRKQAFSAGLFGFNADIQPDRVSGGPTNRYRDLGIDASYQFLGTREHIATVYGSYIHERQTRDALIAGGEASNRTGSLDELKLSASYYFRQTYGLTASRFMTHGSRDALLYANGTSGSPNSSGYILQADWTPFGKEGSWGAPWANLRLGAQYTWYDKFDGAKNNYDGTGRDAKDNNTLFLFAWMSF